PASGDLGDARCRVHLVSLFDGCKTHLVDLVRVGQQLVVVELYDKGDLVRIFTRHRAKDAVGRGHRIASAFDRELYDVFPVEVVRILGKTSSGRVFNPLVDGQYRHITGPPQAAVSKQPLEVDQDPDVAVRTG